MSAGASPAGESSSVLVSRGGPSVVASAFLLLGAGFFLVFCAGLVWAPEVVFAVGRSPRAAAALHAAILGWLVPVGFAVTYLSLPRLGDPETRDGLGAKAHFFLHGVALLWILAAFLGWDIAAVAHAGVVMLVGLLVGLALVAWRLDRGERLQMVQITVATSFLWLMLTMFLGVLAGANHYWFFLPLGTLKAVHAGLHAGFGGYLVLLLIGLSYVMFEVPVSGGGERRLWSFLLCNGGLYAAVLGLAFGLPVVIPGALSVAAGLVFYAVEVASGVAARDVRLDAWNHGYAAGFIGLFLLLGVGLLVGEFDVIPAALWDPMRIVYGYLWIVLATGLPLWCIAGKMLGAPGGGNVRAPGFSILLYVAAAVIGAWGIGRGDVAAVRVSGLLMVVGGAGILAAIAPPCARSILATRGGPDTADAGAAEAAGGAR